MEKRRTTIGLSRYLRKHFPTKKPVRVSICKTEMDTTTLPHQREFGETIDMGKYYLIKINKDDEQRVQKDTLQHEWAHCVVDWTNRSDHGNKWALAYARIYRKVDE